MKILESLCQFDNTVSLAIGSFDGIHLGHAQVIQSCLTQARAQNLESVVLTFQNHPKTITHPQSAPPVLTTPTEKARLLKDLGVDTALMVPFDEALSHMSPQAFIEDILIKTLRAKHISVGYNFHFGYQAKGSPELLKSYSEHFDVTVQPPQKHEGTVVSSTLIRRTLQEGELSQALTLLGRPFLIHGRVVKGQGIAQKVLGVPTANLGFPPEKLIPKLGVYACDVFYGDQSLQGIVNIGNRPTFNGLTLSVEAFIFDFSADLYGQEITLSLKSFIRPEKRFDNPEALKSQIQHDIAQAKQRL